MDDLILEPNEVGVQNDGEPTVVEPVIPLEEVAEKEQETIEEPAVDTDAEIVAARPKAKPGSQVWKEKAIQEAEEKEYWKRQAMQNKAEVVTAPTPVPTGGEPNIDDYDTHEAWVKATARYEIKQEMAMERGKEQWEKKSHEARAKYSDFDEALEAASTPSPAVSEVISASPMGAEVAYYLATHATEYKRINNLSPIATALELGRLEAKLAPSEKKKEAPTATKAPKPLSPVTSPVAAKPADDRFEIY